MNLKKIRKTYNDWKWAALLLLLCIAGIPLTIFYGIQSVNWGNDFWPNALSEFLGMFVELIFGALFTFVVIDKYIQYNKNLQWKKIKNISYKNLYFILSDLLLKLNLSFPKEMRVESFVITEDIETLNDYLPKKDFASFADALAEKIGKKIQQESQCNASALQETDYFEDEQLYGALVKFKQHSKNNLNSLSSLAIPKLLNFSDDIKLLDSLIELEELLTSLMSKFKTLHKTDNVNTSKVKCIWLLKLQEMLKKIKEISSLITEDVNLD